MARRPGRSCTSYSTCGRLEDGAGIVLQREELDDFRFTDPAELSEYLAPYGVRRVTAALEARASGAAVYQPTRVS
jgi:hypothetical protein